MNLSYSLAALAALGASGFLVASRFAPQHLPFAAVVILASAATAACALVLLKARRVRGKGLYVVADPPAVQARRAVVGYWVIMGGAALAGVLLLGGLVALARGSPWDARIGLVAVLAAAGALNAIAYATRRRATGGA